MKGSLQIKTPGRGAQSGKSRHRSIRMRMKIHGPVGEKSALIYAALFCLDYRADRRALRAKLDEICAAPAAQTRLARLVFGRILHFAAIGDYAA